MLVNGDLTERIIGAAIEVHRAVGPGLLESAYEAFLVHELNLAGLYVERQIDLPVHYKECRVDCAFRLDLVVANSILVELKAVEKLLPIHESQLLTYLRLSGIRTGLLINFNTRLLRDGIVRRVV